MLEFVQGKMSDIVGEYIVLFGEGVVGVGLIYAGVGEI